MSDSGGAPSTSKAKRRSSLGTKSSKELLLKHSTEQAWVHAKPEEKYERLVFYERLFFLLDEDSSMYVERGECDSLLSYCLLELEPISREAVMSIYDSSHDGRLNRFEFCRLCADQLWDVPIGVLERAVDNLQRAKSSNKRRNQVYWASIADSIDSWARVYVPLAYFFSLVRLHTPFLPPSLPFPSLTHSFDHSSSLKKQILIFNIDLRDHYMDEYKYDIDDKDGASILEVDRDGSVLEWVAPTNTVPLGSPDATYAQDHGSYSARGLSMFSFFSPRTTFFTHGLVVLGGYCALLVVLFVLWSVARDAAARELKFQTLQMWESNKAAAQKLSKSIFGSPNDRDEMSKIKSLHGSPRSPRWNLGLGFGGTNAGSKSGVVEVVGEVAQTRAVTPNSIKLDAEVLPRNASSPERARNSSPAMDRAEAGMRT